MYVDVHCSSMLRSLVSNRVEWYVECGGRMSREVSYVEWLGFYWRILMIFYNFIVYILYIHTMLTQ
jgi:hypothetical protein